MTFLKLLAKITKSAFSERYVVATHKESGIVNDPNLWCDTQSALYIIDLLKRIVMLSTETMKIMKALPKLGLCNG